MNGPLLWSAPKNHPEGTKRCHTRGNSNLTHIILSQYCCQLNTIRALNTRTALFIQPTAVWQREMNTSCDNFPISSLITVSGSGLRLLPAADGRAAEELQRLLSGLGRSTEECLFWSVGALAEIFQPETSNSNKVNGGKPQFLWLMLLYRGLSFSDPGKVLLVELIKFRLMFAGCRIHSHWIKPFQQKHNSLNIVKPASADHTREKPEIHTNNVTSQLPVARVHVSLKCPFVMFEEYSVQRSSPSADQMSLLDSWC